MRTKKPRRSSVDEVKITRSGDVAIIEHADPTVAVVHMTIGPAIHQMSIEDILNLYNDTIEAQEQLAAAHDNVVIEVPPGHPQIRYAPGSDQWVPRGRLVRCFIDENEDGELLVHIDNNELTLREFSRMLLTFNGFGMRIAFVEEDCIYEEPEVIVCDPQDGEL